MHFLRHFIPCFAIAAAFMATSNLDASPQLDELKAGNQRFINHKPQKCDLNFTPRDVQAETQAPFAIIVACSDSRVSPEIIFDQSNGDLFVVRLAGNTIDDLALGSIEYANTYLKSPLLVILGHENCGAVAATFKLGNKSFSSNIESLLNQVYPAVEKTRETHKGTPDKELLDLAIRENIRHTHEEILQRSPTLKKALAEKNLEIVDGLFSISTGKVEWLSTPEGN
jgi:carbonic anhydrase